MSLELLSQIQSWLFAAVVVGLVALEWLSPLRRRPDKILPRWPVNIGLYLVNACLLFLILPGGLLLVIIDQPVRGLVATGLPLWLTVLATTLIIDGWRYWLHRWYHEVPLLWRVHLTHHSDTEVDITTTERHHPLEAVVSLAAILALVVLLGLPVEGVAVYLLIAMVVALVSHANIDLPPVFDQMLRQVIVTPAVHAIHHSDRQAETDSNYGAVFTVWDRLFGTYTRPGRGDISFGLEYFRESVDKGFWRTLLQPFTYTPQMAYPGQVPAKDTGLRIPALLAACTAGFVIVTLALWPTTASMLGVWAERTEWQYAFLVLPVFVYLVGWEYRAELQCVPISPGWSGLWLAIPAAAVVLVGEILAINIGKQIGLVLFFQAVLLSAVGFRAYFRYLPLWALLFLVVPYEDVVMPMLRATTLWSVEAVSAIAGLPFSADGYAFEVSGNHYAIVPACAGVSFFTLAIFLGYSFGLIAYRRLLPILSLTIASGLAAVVANSFRVNAIIAVDLWQGTQADLAGHKPWWWTAFALMCVLIILLVSRLRIRKRAVPVRAADEYATTTRWWAPAAVAALSGLVALGLAGLSKTEVRSVTELRPFVAPEQLGQFRAQAPAGRWRERAGRDTAFSSTLYVNGSSQRSVAVVIPLSPAMKLDPQRIEPDEDREWSYSRFDIRDACYTSRCISYVHHVWRLTDTEDIYNVYSSYVIADTLTASKLAVRLNRGLGRLFGTPDRAAIVAITSDDPITDPAQVAEQLMRVAAGIETSALMVAL